LSRACPGERSTSCTTGGTADFVAVPTALRCKAECFFLHSSHCPPMLYSPQAHLRCNVPAGVHDRDGSGALCANVLDCPLIYLLFLARTTPPLRVPY
jgi:hypothetical protein